MSQAVATPSTHPIARHWDRGVLVISLIYFAAKAGYYALNIAPSVPPDESAHYGISGVFAKTLGLPQDSAESYPYGLITHSPTLYYYVMGRVANANFFFETDLYWLRLVNVMIGISTIVFGYLWMCLFTPNRAARALFAVMVTNIPMFTFLCASVSYDNLANCLAAAGFYCLALFYTERRPSALGAFLVVILLGCLTKYTFIPLAGMLLLLLLIHERKRLLALPRRAAAAFRPFTPRRLWLPAVVSTLAAANLFLYGGNWMQYRRLVPNARQVLTLDQCMQNPIFARDHIAQEFREGRMTLHEAFQAAGRITDDGIKAALAEMLTRTLQQAPSRQPDSASPTEPSRREKPTKRKNETSQRDRFRMGVRTTILAAVHILPSTSQEREPPAMTGESSSTDLPHAADAPADHSASPGRYAPLWAGQIAETTFRILAQVPAFRTDAEFREYLAQPEVNKIYPPNPAFKSGLQLFVYGALFTIAAATLVLTLSIPSERRKQAFGTGMGAASSAILVSAYTLLVFWVNYGSFTTTGVAALAVQGRYLFPVLVPTYGLAASLLVCCWPRRLQVPIMLLIAAWFLYGDFAFTLPVWAPHWFV